MHAHGVTDVATSAQAASALEPLAGHFAAALFAGGIVGTGLLAIPVLSASAAYGIGEACRWNVSLEKPPRQAAQFYGVIAAATLVGLALNFAHIDPVNERMGALRFRLEAPYLRQNAMLRVWPYNYPVSS